MCVTHICLRSFYDLINGRGGDRNGSIRFKLREIPTGKLNHRVGKHKGLRNDHVALHCNISKLRSMVENKCAQDPTFVSRESPSETLVPLLEFLKPHERVCLDTHIAP